MEGTARAADRMHRHPRAHPKPAAARKNAAENSVASERTAALERPTPYCDGPLAADSRKCVQSGVFRSLLRCMRHSAMFRTAPADRGAFVSASGALTTRRMRARHPSAPAGIRLPGDRARTPRDAAGQRRLQVQPDLRALPRQRGAARAPRRWRARSSTTCSRSSRKSAVRTLDITGGAPELNPHFRTSCARRASSACT